MKFRTNPFQFWRKKLDIPSSYIIKQINKKQLSIKDLVMWKLSNDNIPIDSFVEEDREVIEKFGVSRIVNLDWDLIESNNIDFKKILLDVDSNVEDLNLILYDKVKYDILPIDYSSKMKEVFSSLLFEISSSDKFGVREEKYKFNNGESTVGDFIYNWDLYKEKDLSFCLSHDRDNKYNITDSLLKDIMGKYEFLLQIVLESNVVDIYSFINNINTLSDEVRDNYIKEVTDSILEMFSDSKDDIDDKVFKEIFKYSSLEDYLRKNAEIDGVALDKLLDELKTLPKDYLLSSDISINALTEFSVIRFLSKYRLKNVVDFDNECGHIFSENNCELLKLIQPMFSYNSYLFDVGKHSVFVDGEEKEIPYNKDDFYQAIRLMILNGPTNWDYNDRFIDYSGITGEFRRKNRDLFLDDDAPSEIKDLFYNKKLSYDDFKNNPSLIDNFKNTNIICGFSKEYLWINSLFKDDEEIDNVNRKKLKIISEYSKIGDSNLQGVFKDYLKEYDDYDNLENLSLVLSNLANSNSREMYNFRIPLANQLLKLDNPMEGFKKIENIFVKNHIPTVGKIYYCFETLHPDFDGFDFSDTSMVSPVLKHSSNRTREVVVFSDLLRAAMGSNNRSIINYLDDIEKGYNLYENIKNGSVNFDNLNLGDKKILSDFSKSLSTLYDNTKKGKKELFNSSSDTVDDISSLYGKISSNTSKDYYLPDRLVRMFCGFSGIDTLEDAKGYIASKTYNADMRNRKRAYSDMVLEKGDLIKGIGSIDYLGDILQNGSVSKEYLGADALSDRTPLDTDLSMITSSFGTIEEKMKTTAANGYGPIWLVMKNDDRFLKTRDESSEYDFKVKDFNKLELFYTGVLGEGHYGIRTGFASSDIDYIVTDKVDDRIGFEIALNGFYIPVVNKEGKIIFSPDDYDKIREKMNGLSYYNSKSDFEFSSNLSTPEIEEIASKISESNMETRVKAKKIETVLENALSEIGLKLKTEIDGDLSEGYVELIDTGSTGRGTNNIGTGDFDFMMRVDKNLINDSDKMKNLKNVLLKNLNKENSTEITRTGDFRLKEVQVDDIVVDLDITFEQKTDSINYSTDMALKDKLDSIKIQDIEKYNYVVSNIILAKEVLKEGGVYKPNRGNNPQGGLGGVGVENWILQNGGSFIDAAHNFLEAAEDKNFSEFKDNYKVWDFGENYLASRKGLYPHDNFVECNMSENGYETMKNVLKNYLNTYNDIENKGMRI